MRKPSALVAAAAKLVVEGAFQRYPITAPSCTASKRLPEISASPAPSTTVTAQPTFACRTMFPLASTLRR